MTEWFLIPLGFAIGVYGTLIGAGGGFLLVPALLFLYPTTRPSVIAGISLAVVFFSAASGCIAHARAKRIDYRTAVTFAAVTVPGAILGALAVRSVPRDVFDGLFGLLLIALAFVTILRPSRARVVGSVASRGMVTRIVVDASGTRHEYSFHQWQGIVLSAGVGFISSLFGIGGGIIHVPALILLLNFPTHIATATSQFVLAVMALAGTSVHLLTGELGPGSGLYRSLYLAAGVIPGAQVGAIISRRVHATWILRLLAISLIVVGARLIAPLFVTR